VETEFIEFLWKDDASNVGDCPSLSRGRQDGRDGYLVVGKKTDPRLRAQVPQVGDDEVLVFVPANVIDRIKDL
jgi:hypothetical protein